MCGILFPFYYENIRYLLNKPVFLVVTVTVESTAVCRDAHLKKKKAVENARIRIKLI